MNRWREKCQVRRDLIPCPRNDNGSGSRVHEMRNWVRAMCKPGSVGGRGGQPPRSTRPGIPPTTKSTSSVAGIEILVLQFGQTYCRPEHSGGNFNLLLHLGHIVCMGTSTKKLPCGWLGSVAGSPTIQLDGTSDSTVNIHQNKCFADVVYPPAGL